MSSPAVDFLRPPHRPIVGWLLFVVGAGSVAASLWFAQRWATERATAEREQQQASEARRTATRPRTPSAPTAVQLRERQAQALLRRPWMQALRAIESTATEPVYLISLSMDPGAGTVRLEAEAPSFDEAVAFVQALDRRGDPLQQVMLASHEQVNDAATARGYVRFAATAQWSTR